MGLIFASNTSYSVEQSIHTKEEPILQSQDKITCISEFTNDDNDYNLSDYNQISIGYLIKKRWRVICLLGCGHFSSVWLVYDYKAEDFRSLKIIRKTDASYSDMINNEIKMFNLLGETGFHINVVRVYNKFIYRKKGCKYNCIVMEVLGKNLLDFARNYNNNRIPENIVKNIARDTLNGLQYIHSLGALHTDIKPENICVKVPKSNIMKFGIVMWNKYSNILGPCIIKSTVSSNTSGIKYIDSFIITDFGSVIFPLEEENKACFDIVTREYRPPEIILGWRYNKKTYKKLEKKTVDFWHVDIWSIGCVIFELLCGNYLFDPYNNPVNSTDADHMVLIKELLGDIPLELIKNGFYSHEIFQNTTDFYNNIKFNYCSLYKTLTEVYKIDSLSAIKINDFLMPMLSLNPYERITASECLKSEWIK
jgi:serine/threonine-protein kinase SRPK3